MDKTGERFGLCEIDRCAWLSSVAIPARDDWTLPALGQLKSAEVFLPGTRRVNFECVNKPVIRFKKLVYGLRKPLAIRQPLLPERMIEYNKNIRFLVER